MSSAMLNTFGKSLNILPIFIETYLMQRMLQMVISCICTHQISMQMSWGMMISHLAYGFDNQNLHLSERDILHNLILGKHHWVWVHYGLVL